MAIHQWFEPMPVMVKIPVAIRPNRPDFKGVILLSIISQFSRTCAAPGRNDAFAVLKTTPLYPVGTTVWKIGAGDGNRTHV
jgi:hypothetical protein